VSIIQNAIDSIQTGIEDYQDEDNRRNVSAVRNISAGILLLYKEKLCRLSPSDDKEILIKANTKFEFKNGNIIILQVGKYGKTVNVKAIKDSFEILEIKVDWKSFEELNKLRNNLEHYYTVESHDVIREIIAKSFLLIRDFFINHLEQDPQEMLGDETWAALLEVSEVYSAEEELCEKSINAVDWLYDSVKKSLKHLRCTKCHSSLIQVPFEDDTYPTINLHCKSCNYDFCFDDVVEQCIDDSLSGIAYMEFKDGGQSPYDTCPECEKNTFIHSEGCCVACDYKMEYKECERCGETLSLDEQYNEGKCSYCEYQWNKMMAE
jgi:hypothetical protein